MEIYTEELKILNAKALINEIKRCGTLTDIHEAEFKVFSQFGDDGIIQYLISQMDIPNKTFIEFGVENYTESSTRFLLMNNNWKGLIIDGSKEHMDSVRSSAWFWRYDLTAVDRFIDRDNINKIFTENAFTGEIGLLSIDIDGNDYWVWERIDTVNPAIVILEYNSVFGASRAVTVPYDPAFNRTKSHYSNLYWGVSLKALCLLAGKKGYYFVGCNSNGNNAYFVRSDKIGSIKVLDVADGYVESKFRESRDKKGNLTYISGAKRLETIKEMSVFDIEADTEIKLHKLIEG